jgi:hypothetical protein
MTRYVLIVLLLLLNAQFVWSTVAKYCGHEAASAFSHLGHHSHQHPTDLLPPVSPVLDVADGSILFPHSDCGFCKNLVAQIAGLSKADQTEQSTYTVADYTSVLYISVVSSDIERPKWIANIQG